MLKKFAQSSNSIPITIVNYNNSNNSNNTAMNSSIYDSKQQTTTITIKQRPSLGVSSSSSPSSGNRPQQQQQQHPPSQQQQQQQSGHRHQKIVVQASTNDLLRCLVNYLCKNCHHLIYHNNHNSSSQSQWPSASSELFTSTSSSSSASSKVDTRDIICWLRSADRTLLTQGWQDIAFMNPVNVVFVYLLIREGLTLADIESVHDLHRQLMTCLYLAFSYMGNEISYPLKPFLVENDRQV